MSERRTFNGREIGTPIWETDPRLRKMGERKVGNLDAAEVFREGSCKVAFGKNVLELAHSTLGTEVFRRYLKVSDGKWLVRQRRMSDEIQMGDPWRDFKSAYWKQRERDRVTRSIHHLKFFVDRK